MATTSGIDKNPVPQSADVPDGPGAFLLLAQRMTLMKGAGIGYVPTLAALATLEASADAFNGLMVLCDEDDRLYRFDGADFIPFYLPGTEPFLVLSKDIAQNSANGNVTVTWSTSAPTVEHGGEFYAQGTSTTRIIAPIDGWYQLDCHLFQTGTGGWFARAMVNGSTALVSPSPPAISDARGGASGASASPRINSPIYLNAADYLEIRLDALAAVAIQSSSYIMLRYLGQF